LLYGTLADKDVDTILGMLSETFSAVAVCTSDSARALPVRQVADHARKYFTRVSQYDSVNQGLNAWRAHAADKDVLFVTGSFTVVGEARRALMEGS
jgi:dihydrofolate synthase/folylpolyglutamate synthase